MSQPQQSFFNKITQVAFQELVDFMGHNQTELVIKLQGQYIKTKVSAKKSDKNFGLSRFSPYDFSNEPVVCSFQVQEDLYFFRSFLNTSQSDYSLQIPAAIFQLQRRNNYRVSIPVGLIYTCEVVAVNGVTKKVKAEIRDLSLGGCQVAISGGAAAELVHQNDEFDIYLKLNRFEFSRLRLAAKHVKVIEGQNSILIGASFDELNADVLAELQAMLMFLDRLHRGKDL